jgi:integrase
MRKGGKMSTVHVPVALIEETQWHVLTERSQPKKGYEDYVFIGNRGLPIGRSSVSKEFRRCASVIGTDATCHHLRHTFATFVLKLLQERDPSEAGMNVLKTLQVLLGHSRAETTEGYLRAVEVTSPGVVSALEALYGSLL